MGRRLAAIFAADVVGFSRLMERDEVGTLARLKAVRKDVVQPAISARGGRVVKLMGDGLLAEFASVIQAVEAALALQQALAGRNEAQSEDQRILLRVGINLGDIIIEGADIYGEGVNIAARLESLAVPGGIAISGKVQEEIEGKLDAAFVDGGEQSVKNIARPIRVWHWSADGVPETHPGEPLADSDDKAQTKPSIAVLPFDNMSEEAEQEYFADGMVEDIITGLSRIKWLMVIARNSSFTYKGKAVDIKQVGRDLGVRYVLEGSLRKATDRIRVTGQLIEAESGRHLWADRYDRKLDDLFAIQDELTMNVVAALEPSLRQAEIERVKRKRPDNLDAYDLLLRAIPLVYPAMPESTAKALPLLESALALEPDYALAHGFAAWAHEVVYARGGLQEENRVGAIRHARAAIAHGRDDAIALSLGAFVTGLVAHDRPAARHAFEAARAVSPSCALAYNLASVATVFDGDAAEAIQLAETAVRLSPVDPMNYAPWLAKALAHISRGEDEAAADAARETATSAWMRRPSLSF